MSVNVYGQEVEWTLILADERNSVISILSCMNKSGCNLSVNIEKEKDVVTLRIKTIHKE